MSPVAEVSLWSEHSRAVISPSTGKGRPAGSGRASDCSGVKVPCRAARPPACECCRHQCRRCVPKDKTPLRRSSVFFVSFRCPSRLQPGCPRSPTLVRSRCRTTPQKCATCGDAPPKNAPRSFYSRCWDLSGRLSRPKSRQRSSTRPEAPPRPPPPCRRRHKTSPGRIDLARDPETGRTKFEFLRTLCFFFCKLANILLQLYPVENIII